ncbi:hypothetical protein [Demequina muriae]|uniref:Peptidase_C39 like family protein n=1 Tax=Demequina muriae TaxID=3051664 RepID=A0ABT8GF44_9MICO|nr:hypothetical protein [Demequina sp. EGI L300058]MDN4479964.1 hypothetical protein [Demequina sp. EGI L300058]
MGWTATSVAASLAATVGLRGRWATPYSAAHAAGRAQRGGPDTDTVFARAYARRRASASAADAKALDTARVTLGDDSTIIERAVAAGAPITAVAGFAAAWDTFPRTAQEAIRRPQGAGLGHVRFGAVRATQVDETTCGAAVMAMMLMMGDPLVAAWLMTGRHFGDYLPREVLAVTLDGPGARTIDERWHALQRVLHHQTTRTGLWVAPWPRALGTPPWRLDDETRFAGVRFRGAVLDDSDAGAVTAAVAHASAALRDGIPVPLYTSGDSDAGLASVVPRHVVLLTGRTDHGFQVYEPGSGRIVPLAEARLFGPGPKEPAYGQWTRASWLVLPQVRRGH